MFLIDWIRAWKQMKKDFAPEVQPCQTCEVLRIELERAHDENRRLVIAITTPKEVQVEKEPDTTDMKPLQIGRRHMTWGVRRQMLEQEDKVQARLAEEKARELAAAGTPSTITVEELEAEVGLAERKRQEETGIKTA